jgi:hypothetical protein
MTVGEGLFFNARNSGQTHVIFKPTIPQKIRPIKRPYNFKHSGNRQTQPCHCSSPPATFMDHFSSIATYSLLFTYQQNIPLREPLYSIKQKRDSFLSADFFQRGFR